MRDTRLLFPSFSCRDRRRRLFFNGNEFAPSVTLRANQGWSVVCRPLKVQRFPHPKALSAPLALKPEHNTPHVPVIGSAANNDARARSRVRSSLSILMHTTAAVALLHV